MHTQDFSMTNRSPIPSSAPIPAFLASHKIIASILLCLFGLLLISLLHRSSPVVDERASLLSGMYALRNHDTSLYWVNPPLVKMLAAVPSLGVDAKFPKERVRENAARESYVMQFNKENQSMLDNLIWRGRCIMVALAVLGGWVIYLWCQCEYGSSSGVIGLILWITCPTVIAFSGLITTDIGAATFALIAMNAFRKYLKEPDLANATWYGVMLGLAQLSKFTLLILYPACVVVLIVSLLTSMNPQNRKPKVLLSSVHFVWAIVLSALVINCGYGWHGTFRRLGDYSFSSQWLTATHANAQFRNNRFEGSWLGEIPVPLPYDYVLGLDTQKTIEESGQPAYLGGEWYPKGSQWYYLYASCFKIQLGTLVLIGMAVMSVMMFASLRKDPVTEALWIAPLLAMGVLLAGQTGINKHFRYVIPCLPFLFIGISRIGTLVAEAIQSNKLESKDSICSASRVMRLKLVLAGVTVVAVSWNFIELIRCYPHYLPFFNLLAGGPSNGWKYLGSSNVDSGQDLFELKKWLNEHPEVSNCRLAFFGGLSPEEVGIHMPNPPVGPPNRLNLLDPKTAGGDEIAIDKLGPWPGWHIVSVSYVIGARDGISVDGEAAPYGCYVYFQQFTPKAKIGYSILIYHISLEEANAVRSQLGLPPLHEQVP